MRATRSAQIRDRDLGGLAVGALGRIRPAALHQGGEGHGVDLGDGASGERHGQCLGPEPAAPAGRARHAAHEPQRPLAHPVALGVGEHVHEVGTSAPELAVVAVVDAVALRLDQHRGLLVGVEQPVPVLLPQPAPRLVDVDAEPGDDAAQVGALPRARPRGDRAVADAERGVGDEGDPRRRRAPHRARGTAGTPRRRCSARTPPPPAVRLPSGRCRRASRASAAGSTSVVMVPTVDRELGRPCAAAAPRPAAGR